MNASEMKQRTKNFTIAVGTLTEKLPFNPINHVYCKQVIRSSSSVGANYRAVRRAKSKPDFINKLKIAEEELDESLYFMELLEVFNSSFSNEIKEISKKGETLLRIIVASIVSAKK